MLWLSLSGAGEEAQSVCKGGVFIMFEKPPLRVHTPGQQIIISMLHESSETLVANPLLLSTSFLQVPKKTQKGVLQP